MNLKITFLMALFLTQSAFADYLVKGTRLTAPHAKTWKTESVQKVSGESHKIQILRSIPKYIAEHSGMAGELYQEILYPESMLPLDIKSQFLKNKKNKLFSAGSEALANAEVRVLLQQGPWKNRINFTIVGDGYLASDKEKFFADAKRITEELFEAKTFKSYAALFNISAVFVPSQVSGLGDGSPINTVFKLYRTPKGSKRAIYVGDEMTLDAAIAKAQATSYPIVIANDDFYGGLGGKYSISTRSERSGLIVLRHELGHSIGEVGEEYDDSQAYFGANSSRSPKGTWSQWVSGELAVHEAKILGGKYVWQDLAAGPFVSQFKTLGIPGELLGMDISSVGWESPEDVKISFDNQEIKFDGNFSIDRNFFFVGPVAGISPGEHTLKIEERVKDGNNVLGFARIYSYPANYDFSPDKIGAFATYNEMGSKTYRPTHNSCLMRNMQTEFFCAVDQENLWIKMLGRIRLIDSLTATVQANGLKKIQLAAMNLPLEIRWSKNQNGVSEALTDFEDMREFEIQLPAGATLKADVTFSTPEVRKTNFKDSASVK